MCFGDTSVPPPPPPPQEAKPADNVNAIDAKKKNRGGDAMGGGSLLTGPSGAAPAPTGKTSLLGG